MLQLAREPAGETSRRLGSHAPWKLGLGQADSSDAVVSRAKGTSQRPLLPCSWSGNANSSARPDGPSGTATWIPLSVSAGAAAPGRNGRSSLAHVRLGVDWIARTS